jgi:hypothetical protein
MNSWRSSGEKCQAVGLGEIFDYCGQLAVVMIEAVDVAGADLRFGFVALVVGVDSVARIGKP